MYTAGSLFVWSQWLEGATNGLLEPRAQRPVVPHRFDVRLTRVDLGLTSEEQREDALRHRVDEALRLSHQSGAQRQHRALEMQRALTRRLDACRERCDISGNFNGERVVAIDCLSECGARASDPALTLIE